MDVYMYILFCCTKKRINNTNTAGVSYSIPKTDLTM